MIVSDGYTAEYYRKTNRIVITLPQTLDTLTSTSAPIANRKTTVTGDELAVVLEIVKKMMEVEEWADITNH